MPNAAEVGSGRHGSDAARKPKLGQDIGRQQSSTAGGPLVSSRPQCLICRRRSSYIPAMAPCLTLSKSVVLNEYRQFDNRLSPDICNLRCNSCSQFCSPRSIRSAGHRSWQWPARSSKQAARATPKGSLRMLCAGDGHKKARFSGRRQVSLSDGQI